MRGWLLAGAFALAITGCGSAASIAWSGNDDAYNSYSPPTKHVDAGQYRVEISGADCWAPEFHPHIDVPNGPSVDIADQKLVTVPASGDYRLEILPAGSDATCTWAVTLVPN